MSFKELLGNKIILFDGGMGTLLQSAGLKIGEFPDPWSITHAQEVKEIHKKYLVSGSDVITSNTFGSNSINAHTMGHSVEELISSAIRNCKDAIIEVNEERIKNGLSERQLFTAFDIGPSGKIFELTGELDFDEAYNLFKEEVVIGTKSGADLIIFETFTDIAELKVGIMAAKENSDLPILCTVTFQEDSRMLLGTDPETAILALQDLGISAIGVNCSLGPKELLPIISRIMKTAKIPVIVQPNAGLPEMIDGVATYNIKEDEFVDYVEKILMMGVSIIGGCCGTTPEYIKKIKDRIDQMGDAVKDIDYSNSQNPVDSNLVCTSTKHILFGNDISIIEDDYIDDAELQDSILEQDFEASLEVALSIIEDGADIVAVNMGFSGENECTFLREIVHSISMNGNIPLAIYSKSPECVESAVRICRGKPIILCNKEDADLFNKFKPVANKYGLSIVLTSAPTKPISGLTIKSRN